MNFSVAEVQLLYICRSISSERLEARYCMLLIVWENKWVCTVALLREQRSRTACSDKAAKKWRGRVIFLFSSASSICITFNRAFPSLLLLLNSDNQSLTNGCHSRWKPGNTHFCKPLNLFDFIVVTAEGTNSSQPVLRYKWSNTRDKIEVV